MRERGVDGLSRRNKVGKSQKLKVGGYQGVYFIAYGGRKKGKGGCKKLDFRKNCHIV